jgi:hypothetical protein
MADPPAAIAALELHDEHVLPVGVRGHRALGAGAGDVNVRAGEDAERPLGGEDHLPRVRSFFWASHTERTGVFHSS